MVDLVAMKDLARSDVDLPQVGPHVVIVGGGASGVLLAVHLLTRPDAAFRVTIVEGRNMLGCGVAYSTTDPDHLLNTRVHNMSAFPDDPHHFLDWLAARQGDAKATAQSFVSRATYGAYLADLLMPWSSHDGSSRLRCVKQACHRVEETSRGVVAHLEDGQALHGDVVVLATGHGQPPPRSGDALDDPWQFRPTTDCDSRIVIVGSGLSMVDQVLSILKSGHRGEILSISRRGQLPRTHVVTTPVRIDVRDIPFGARLSVLLAWVRARVAEAERAGGVWQDAMDGIRPHVRAIWRSLSPVEKARFLRHGATWWDVHRHRLPAHSHAMIERAIGSGQLVLRRAAFLGVDAGDAGDRVVRILPKGSREPVSLVASRVIDCRGIRRDPEDHPSPLIADLLASGRARVDPLRIGLDVDHDCRVVDGAGEAARRIFAIGPASRAAFWEITAIPDIREQVRVLAADLAVAFGEMTHVRL